VTAYRTQKMLKVALCIANGALTRTESRGAHFREDFPRATTPVAQAHAGHLADPSATLPTLSYEPLDVIRDGAAARLARLRRQGLRRPPRHAAARAAEVASGSASGSRARTPRVQAAMMPYEHLLPERFRGPQRTHRREAAMTDHHPTPRPGGAPAAVPRSAALPRPAHDPRDPSSARTEVFELEEAAGMTLFIALNEIREQLDPSLAFDFVCRAGICGSCGMVVNGARASPAAR
jgi:hypothetical protein